MGDSVQSRREFIFRAGTASAAWIALQAPLLASLSACARDAARRDEPFTTLTPTQGRTMTVVADRIIPAVDGLPGASEAGAVHFIGLALGGTFAQLKDPVVEGLSDLDRRAHALRGSARSFAELSAAEQDRLIAAVEKTPFFEAARMLVIIGTLSDPGYGGNRNGAGWRLIQLEHRPSWQPPFGYYDAEWMREHAGDVT